MSDLPPLHSEKRSRTRPARRRPPLPAWSGADARRQRQLGRAMLTIAVIVVAALLGPPLLDGGGDTATATATATTANATTATTPRPVPGAVLVDVVKIVDGDTIDVRAAQTEMRVRFYGVNTPERGERCYAEATARTKALAGDRVLLLADARLQDRSGRELRYVFTPAGASIDEALVREGFALAWREDGSRRDALVALEDQARAAKVGCLWSAGATPPSGAG